MAWLEIPTRTDISAYSYKISLEGTTFSLRFSFNDRVGKWMLQIADQSDVVLLNEIPLVSNWDLISRFVTDGLPLGALYAFDTSGTGSDAGRFDLGERVKLLYRESTTT